MSDLAPLLYPQLFQGLFARQRARFEPLLEAARGQLDALAVPATLRPFYDTVVRENPQPSFMLMPLMFLATAEASGGIQEVHRKFLPYMMLSMEVIAVADDTVDRTPMRSGRPTFATRFSEASATPFVIALLALLARETGHIEPRLLEVTMGIFIELSALQLWECKHTYPMPDEFAVWLDNRNRQSELGVSFGLDTALLLGGRALIPAAMLPSFGRIMQDVDDIVNILEDREAAGENDDLVMGMVTRPLLLTLERYPGMRAELEALWANCRDDRAASVNGQREPPAGRLDLIRALARPIREAIREVGVPGTVAQVLADYHDCVAATPLELRPVVGELARSWVDRLRRCNVAGLVTQAQIDGAIAGIPMAVA